MRFGGYCKLCFYLVVVVLICCSRYKKTLGMMGVNKEIQLVHQHHHHYQDGLE